jgi:hypothetical protein
MPERPRFHLQTFGAVRLPAGPPTVDEARASLGGRAATSPDAGCVVRVGGAGTAAALGVVVFASPEERDVWIGQGRLQRVSSERCEPVEGPVDPSLGEVAADAARFAALSEGVEVRYLDRLGKAHLGRLVEKCRYGALVEDTDGRVLAVSFRRLWVA